MDGRKVKRRQTVTVIQDLAQSVSFMRNLGIMFPAEEVGLKQITYGNITASSTLVLLLHSNIILNNDGILSSFSAPLFGTAAVSLNTPSMVITPMTYFPVRLADLGLSSTHFKIMTPTVADANGAIQLSALLTGQLSFTLEFLEYEKDKEERKR